MEKKYWLFARPIYYDKSRKENLSYCDYYDFGKKEALYRGFEADYKKSDRPCLVLRNLLTDLFFGSKVYRVSEYDKKLIVATDRLIITDDPNAKSVVCFFPFFEARQEYESRFKSKKRSGTNPYANQLNALLRQNPKKCIEDVKSACERFLTESCTVVNEEELIDYLVSRIKIYIDYVTEKGKFSPLEKGSEEIRERSLETIKNGLKSISEDRHALLARLMILSGLNWERIDSPMLHTLLVGKEERVKEAECDKFYRLYCEENKTDFPKLRSAYERLSSESDYYKEIVGDYAEHLMNSPIGENRKKAFKLLTELGQNYKKHGKIYYLLALCRRSGIGCKKNEQLATELFNKAAELDDARALLFLAEEAFGSPVADKKTAALEYCTRILSLSPHARKDLIGRAAFIIAEIHFSVNNDKATAKDYYRISADASYNAARYRLRQLERPNRLSPAEAKKNPVSDQLERNMIVCGCKDVIESIRAKLSPAEWNMFFINETAESKTYVRDKMIDYLDAEYGESLEAEDYPTRSVFVFAESDSNVNLRNTLYLLDRLYNKYNDLLISTGDENDAKILGLMRSFDIYLSADYETASTMIDASIGDMGDNVYFKVHILDTNKILSEQLLYRAPLFIPTIRGEGNPEVITFGSSDFIYNFIREATASAYMKSHPVKITAVDGNIAKAENKFKQNCGGIYTTGLKRIISPDFIDFDLTRSDLDDIVSGRPVCDGETVKKLKSRIKTGNYFVVDIGSDMENVLFAKNLRTWLLRSRANFNRIPFIAVRCRDSVNAFWISRLHSGGGRRDPHWYNDYDFYIFGMMNDIYPHEITDAVIERIALGVHLSYSGNPTEGEIARFWQNSYHRDSSRATAVGLVYRMFDGEVALNNYRSYHAIDFRQMALLAEEYDRKLKLDSKRERLLAVAEQARWNCFMLSRGWLPASPEQVRVYAEVLGYCSHKYDLCKLHPYIRDWEDIGDGENSCPEKIRKIIPTAISPIEATVRSIVSTRSFFREISLVPNKETALL